MDATWSERQVIVGLHRKFRPLQLIKTLLIRECVEPNPGPSNMPPRQCVSMMKMQGAPATQNVKQPNHQPMDLEVQAQTHNHLITFRKTPGHADMSGELYEIKVAALLFIRGLRLTKSFFMASNLSGAGVFDDIVFIYRDQYQNDSCTICFFQLKHKKSHGRRSMVKMKDILSLRGDFSLPKYCNSYNVIKRKFATEKHHLIFRENFDSCIFALYTNACSSKELPTMVSSRLMETEYILTTGGNVSSFNAYRDQEVFKYFEDLPRYRNFLYALRTDIHKNINLAERIDNFTKTLSSELSVKLLRLKKKLNVSEVDNLISAVEEVGDFSDHQEFLSRLYMFTSQASEKEIDDVIHSEIREMFASSERETATIFKQLIENVQIWWKYENFYLSETAPFWQNIIQTRVNQINEAKIHELDRIGIRFNSLGVQNIQNALRINFLLNIVTDCKSTNLSCLKVYQALSEEQTSYLVASVETLLHREKEIMCLWPNRCPVLVITFDGLTQTLDQMWDSSFHILRPENAERIIVISTSPDQICDHLLKEKVKEHFVQFHDEFSFMHLSEESQNSLLSTTTVLFQGSPVCFQSIIEKSPELTEAINAEMLLQLLYGGHTIAVGKAIDGEIDYYIPRVLETYQCINTTILATTQADFPGVIAVSGYTAKELMKFTPRGTKIKVIQTPSSRRTSDNLLVNSYPADVVMRSLSVQEPEKDNEENRNITRHSSDSEASGNVFDSQNSSILYIIDSDEDFCELCKEHTDVHWLMKYEKKGTEVLKWVRSQGDVKIIYQHLNTSIKTEYGRVDSVCNLPDRITLVVAEPGMGKSTLLSHIAVETKKANPDMWVLKINLNDYTSYLKRIDPSCCNEERVFNFLCLAANIDKSNLEKKILEYYLRESGNLAILMDGYDEISPTNATKAGAILQYLCKTKVKKLWVSTRPIMRNFLEELLSVFAFKLQPFSTAEQEEFMHNFWRSKCSNIHCNIEVLAKRLLTLSSKFLDGHFMGIPLQTMMLAEAYEYHISKGVELPESLDLLQLYEEFVEKKVDIYCNDKKKIDTTKESVLEDNEYWHNVFLEDHILASMTLLFPPFEYANFYTPDATIRMSRFLSKILEGREKTGIINNVIDNKPQFIHRTFADYFVGRCIMILYQPYTNSTVYQSIKKYFNSSLLLEEQSNSIYEAIFNQDFEVVRNIFDRQLTQGYALHSALVSKDKPLILQLIANENDINMTDSGGRTPLHLAACYCTNAVTSEVPETNEVVKALLNKGADANLTDKVLNWRPLRYADRMKAWDTIEYLLQNSANPEDLVIIKSEASKGETRQDILHIAVSRGYKSLLQFVLSKKCSLGTKYKHFEEYERYMLLRTAVKNEQWTVLQFLVENYIDINTRFGEGDTVLHWAARQGKPQAISELVRLNADINIRNNYGNTPLHCAAKYGSLSVVTEIVRLGGDVSITNNDGNTALYQAANHGMWHIVNHLLLLGSNINIGSIGNTPLHSAAEKGEVDIIRQLVQSHADINIRNSGGNTPLHWAVWKGTAETISVIVQLNADINACNSQGETPLCWAAKQNQWDKVELLLELGANTKVSNNKGNVPLHWAAKHGNCNIINQLVKFSYVDIKDNFGNTPLHFAAGSGKCDLIEQLILLGAPINIQNSTGNTPLHWAVGEGRNDAVKVLVRLGANLEARNTTKNTALHIASGQSRQEADDRFSQLNMVINPGKAKNKLVYRFYGDDNVEMVELLMGLGSCVNRRNKKGNTPLHIACLRGNIKVVQYLVHLKIPKNVKNRLGMTPLDLAYKSTNSLTKGRIIELLKAEGASRGNIIARLLPI